MAKVLLGCFALAILLSALFSVISGPGLRGLALALGIPAIGASVLGMLWDAPGVMLADDVLGGSFLLFVTIVVLHAVLSAANVTWEVVNGALCVYLLPRSLAVRRSQPFASRERVLSRSSTMGERPRR